MNNSGALSPETAKNLKSKKKPRPIIDFVSENYESFKQIEIDPETQSIDLTDNFIENFIGLPFLKYLTNLNLDDNPIISFEGAIQLPCLKWLSMKNTPLSRNKFFRIICIIAFGPQLSTINNEPVTKSMRQKAEVLKKPLIPYLKKGFVISSLNPLRLSNFRLEAINNHPKQDLINAVSSLIHAPPSGISPVSSPTKREIQRASVSTMISIFNQNENIEDIIPTTMIKFITKNMQALRNRFNDETPDNNDIENEESLNKIQAFEEEEDIFEILNEEETNNEIKEKHIDIEINSEEEEELTEKAKQNKSINLGEEEEELTEKARQIKLTNSGEEEEDNKNENEQISRSSSRSNSSDNEEKSRSESEKEQESRSESEKEQKSRSESEKEQKSHSESEKEQRSRSESEKEERSHSESEKEQESRSESESESHSEKSSKRIEDQENEVTSNSSGSEREERSNSENEEEEKIQNNDNENKEEEEK